MEILRNAPTLKGGHPCPSCKALIEQGAVLCIHCGYNLATGQTASRPTGAGSRILWMVLALVGLSIVAGAVILFVRSSPPTPPSDASSILPLATTSLPIEMETMESPDDPVPQPVPPSAPAAPRPEELAARQAEAARAEFEASKAESERAFRNQIEEREPMYRIGDTIEVRRRNGVFHRGELQRFSGTGPDRVAVVATMTGEIGIPLDTLDPASRRRMDQEYREAYIAHMLTTPLRPAKPAADNE